MAISFDRLICSLFAKDEDVVYFSKIDGHSTEILGVNVEIRVTFMGNSYWEISVVELYEVISYQPYLPSTTRRSGFILGLLCSPYSPLTPFPLMVAVPPPK